MVKKSNLLQITWSYTEDQWEITKTCYLDKYRAESVIISLIDTGGLISREAKREIVEDKAVRMETEKVKTDIDEEGVEDND